MIGKCNICGESNFADMGGRKNVRCVSCQSLERTRLLWLHIQNLELPPNPRILHIAPEKGLRDALRERYGSTGYECADITPGNYPLCPEIRKIDLCALDDEESEKYDLILHSHVLEHTPCNIAYTLRHLHRMLKVEGVHMFVVPFLSGYYDECFSGISVADRVRRFGQDDHVRRFGVMDLHTNLGALINLPSSFDLTHMFTARELEEANIPSSQWTGPNPTTVLQLRRPDFKLADPREMQIWRELKDLRESNRYLNDVLQSTSWRITSPLRAISTLVRSFR